MVTVHRLVLAVIAVLLVASATEASSHGPSRAPAPAAEPVDVVYSPVLDTGPAPVTVFLHGMCDTPENECGHFARAVARRGWLVCPRAPNACGNGGSRWGWGAADGALVEAAVERLQVRYPDRVAAGGRTLIGFSQGAFVAAEILQRRDQPYDYALLIAGKVPLRSDRVSRAGVTRVLLSAGDRDLSSSFMQNMARSLARDGVDARFFSLGRVGHTFAEDMDTWLEGALTWLWAPRHTV